MILTYLHTCVHFLHFTDLTVADAGTMYINLTWFGPEPSQVSSCKLTIYSNDGADQTDQSCMPNPTKFYNEEEDGDYVEWYYTVERDLDSGPCGQYDFEVELETDPCFKGCIDSVNTSPDCKCILKLLHR